VKEEALVQAGYWLPTMRGFKNRLLTMFGEKKTA
jgi:hypothetical protein